jgi:hypothetical protein
VCGIFSTKVIATIDLIALEAVFPRHHQPQRRTFLLRQRLAVQAGDQERERVHRPRRCAGPRGKASRARRSLARHLLAILQGGEGHVLRLRRGLETLEHVGQRHAQPRNDIDQPSTHRSR